MGCLSVLSLLLYNMRKFLSVEADAFETSLGWELKTKPKPGIRSACTIPLQAPPHKMILYLSRISQGVRIFLNHAYSCKNAAPDTWRSRSVYSLKVIANGRSSVFMEGKNKAGPGYLHISWGRNTIYPETKFYIL